MSNPTPLIPSEEHLNERCKRGQGSACCIFLSFTPGEGFTCERGGGFDRTLRQRRDRDEMNAASINCTGAPDFKHSEEAPCAHCGMVMEFIEGKCLICELPFQP